MYVCWVGLVLYGVLYEINWIDCGVMRVLWGYYIYGRDSVIIFDMGIYGGLLG